MSWQLDSGVKHLGLGGESVHLRHLSKSKGIVSTFPCSAIMLVTPTKALTILSALAGVANQQFHHSRHHHLAVSNARPGRPLVHYRTRREMHLSAGGATSSSNALYLQIENLIPPTQQMRSGSPLVTVSPPFCQRQMWSGTHGITLR